MDEHDWVELKYLLSKLNIKYGTLTDADSREFCLKCREYELIDNISLMIALLEA